MQCRRRMFMNGIWFLGALYFVLAGYGEMPLTAATAALAGTRRRWLAVHSGWLRGRGFVLARVQATPAAPQVEFKADSESPRGHSEFRHCARTAPAPHVLCFFDNTARLGPSTRVLMPPRIISIHPELILICHFTESFLCDDCTVGFNSIARLLSSCTDECGYHRPEYNH